MKRLLCVALLLVGGCLLPGCTKIKRIELGKPHDPAVIEANLPGFDVKIRALSINFVWEEDE